MLLGFARCALGRATVADRCRTCRCPRLAKSSLPPAHASPVPTLIPPRRFPASLLLVALLVLTLSACAIKPRRDDVGWRRVTGTDLVEIDAFRVAGRLAVSDGRDGGSASFLWTQLGDRYEFELRQPVSQRTWRLTGGARGAVLEGGDHGPVRAASGEELLREVLGWEVPMRALQAWVRGLADAGLAVQAQSRDDQGRLQVLEQGGWQVQYRGWLDGSVWPTRVQAQQPPYSVRLSIQDWFVRDDR